MANALLPAHPRIATPTYDKQLRISSLRWVDNLCVCKHSHAHNSEAGNIIRVSLYDSNGSPRCSILAQHNLILLALAMEHVTHEPEVKTLIEHLDYYISTTCVSTTRVNVTIHLLQM